MDFASFLQVIARRWKLVAVCLVVTVVCAFSVGLVMKPTYEAQASVLLYSPSGTVGTGSGPTPPATSASGPAPPATSASSQNPLYDIGDLSVATDVMAQRMADRSVVEQVNSRGAGGTWTVAQNIETRSPLLVVTSDASTNDESIRTMKNVLAGIDQQLRVLQNQTPTTPSDRVIRTQLVREDPAATAKSGSRVRALVAVLVLGIIGSFSLPFAADALQAARSRRTRRVQARGKGSGGRRRGSSPKPPAPLVPSRQP
jgi:Chain length determinant protein